MEYSNPSVRGKGEAYDAMRNHDISQRGRHPLPRNPAGYFNLKHRKEPKMKTRTLLTICILLAVTGCVVEKDSSGAKTVRVDAEKAEQVEKGAEAAISVSEALTVVWPGFAAVSVGLTGLLAAWRKNKGKLTEAQTETQMYHSVTGSIVDAIEAYKEGFPDDWGYLKEKLAEKIGPKGEAIIRALRKPPEKT